MSSRVTYNHIKTICEKLLKDLKEVASTKSPEQLPQVLRNCFLDSSKLRDIVHLLIEQQGDLPDKELLITYQEEASNLVTTFLRETKNQQTPPTVPLVDIACAIRMVLVTAYSFEDEDSKAILEFPRFDRTPRVPSESRGPTPRVPSNSRGPTPRTPLTVPEDGVGPMRSGIQRVYSLDKGHTHSLSSPPSPSPVHNWSDLDSESPNHKTIRPLSLFSPQSEFTPGLLSPISDIPKKSSRQVSLATLPPSTPLTNSDPTTISRGSSSGRSLSPRPVSMPSIPRPIIQHTRKATPESTGRTSLPDGVGRSLTRPLYDQSNRKTSFYIRNKTLLFSPVVAPSLYWQVEDPSDILQNPELTEVKELYAQKFGQRKAHMNFIGLRKGEAYSIISIHKKPHSEFPLTTKQINLGPSYKALYVCVEGSEEFYLHNIPVQKGGTDMHYIFADFLNDRLLKKEDSFYPVRDKHLVEDLITLEKKHTPRPKAMKIAVLYTKNDQTTIQDIFSNNPPKENRFWTFLNQIAEEIFLKDWKGYRGDLGHSGNDIKNPSYWTNWRGLDIIFHIAPYMDSEQHRRLIGNDIAVIIFFDNEDSCNESVVLFNANDIGIVPQVFAVVEPDPDNVENYRLGFFNGRNLGNYRPQCPPSNYFFHFEDLKDFLFTKMHNGYVMSMSVPPMNRLFTVPRKEAIKELGLKYEQTNRKEEKKREILEAKKIKRKSVGDFSNNSITSNNFLKVALIEGKGLTPREGTTSNTMCQLRLMQQNYKSPQIKKSLNPKWNMEFIFRLSVVNPLDEFQVVCQNTNKDGKSDYMGEYSVQIKDMVFGEAIWCKLYSTTTEEATGELKLKFTKISEDVYRKEQEKGPDAITVSPNEEEKLIQLASTITIENGISIKDRKWHLKTYKRCIIGSELIDWFLDRGVVDTREEAIMIGRKLGKLNLLLHVKKENIDFKDEYVFYQVNSSGKVEG